MEQITLNYDASEFDGFESTQEFFAHSTFGIKDGDRRNVKQCVQAMEMDMSPSQWAHKRNQSNNTAITLNDIDRHTEIFGDVRWIYFAIQKHIIKSGKSKEELLKLKAEIEKQLEAA